MAKAKKKAARKAAAASVSNVKAIKEKYTKTQILNEIAENTELSKKQVSSVLDELAVLIERHVKKRAAGEFTLPGILKIKAVKKPARKARKNVPNPFRPGEFMDIAAKPASTKVKVLPLQKLRIYGRARMYPAALFVLTPVPILPTLTVGRGDEFSARYIRYL